MQEYVETPDHKVADAVPDNWVDRYAPVVTRPYLRLSRADRPIGTWLLLIPCWWGLALAILHTDTVQLEDLWIAFGCGCGAWLMRGAGCTWNDITDRNFDRQVMRTKSRPIPSGQISVRNAVIWMCVQTLAAFSILLTFNAAAITLGILSLLPVAIYPFAKRITWWPQIFLGIAFNWGAMLAWVAHTGSLHIAAVILYLAGISWTLFYDTIYAHQDSEDDALIGIKSTARLFGSQSPIWLKRFLILVIILLGASVYFALVPKLELFPLIVSLTGVTLMTVHLERQRRNFNSTDSATLLQLFRSNRNAGFIFLIFLISAAML
ncbi:MAG: 4-hydroxybenzoate octaprenyltransferase [Aestuariivita sp.]|nr:4-hydroxybenzoate octaprenyltransferase [Aestuariivita sp.]